MKPRYVALLFVVVALLAVVGALWLGLSAGVSAGNSCGPIVTQRGAGSTACDGFFRTRYLQVAVLGAVAAVAYLASVVIERRLPEADRTEVAAEATA